MTDPAVFRRYRDDWDAYAREVAGVHLWSKQREIVAAVQEHERVAVKSGNATGKTYVQAFVMQHHLAGGPGSVVVSTAPTERQLRFVLWKRFREQLPRRYFAGAVVNELEVRLGPDWFAVGLSTDTPEAFQGIHAERVLIVVDEASGVDEGTYEAIEGIMAGGDARLLLVGNPMRTSGTFFDAFHARRDEFFTLTISAFDTPAFTGEKMPRAARRNLVKRGWVERLERRQAGTNEYRIKVLGEFPSAQEDAAVSVDEVAEAQRRTLEPGLPLVLGFDVARFGSDESVLALRRGNVIRIVDSWQGLSLMESTGRVIDHARRVQTEEARRPKIVVDDTGLGGGVTDRLRELGFDVHAFNGSASARRPKAAANRRSELWLTAGEVMPLLDLDTADEELARELVSPTYSFDSSGARVVEPKSNTRKRLRRSPDRADAVLLTLAVDPPSAPGRERRRLPSVSFTRALIREPDPARWDPQRGEIASRVERPTPPGSTVTKTPPVDLSAGGFTWNGHGRGEPDRPRAEVVSQAGLISQAMRGIDPRPRRRREQRQLRRGLHVPVEPPAPLEEIARAAGIPLDGGGSRLPARSTPEPVPDALADLAVHDVQSECLGYFDNWRRA